MSKLDNVLTDRLQNASKQIPYLAKALSLVRKAAPRSAAIWLLLLVAQGLIPLFVVYIVRELVDIVAAGLGQGGGWSSMRPAMVLVGMLAVALLLGELLGAVSTWVRTIQSEKVGDYVRDLIHRKSVTLDLSFFESPAFYDLMHRAQVDAQMRPAMLLENMGSLIQHTITLVAMASVLVPFGLWLPVVLLLSTLPALAVVISITIKEHNWRIVATERIRRAWYYDFLLTARETAAELRLFALGNHFRGIYRAIRGGLRLERIALAKRQSMSEIGAGILALLATGAAAAWMLWQASLGKVSLGDLALFYQAFSQGQRLMRSLLQSAGQIYSNSLFLNGLFEFLEMESVVLDPDEPREIAEKLNQGIDFVDVQFGYPGGSRLALANFNFSIKAGEITAVVGPNGAGKSTLIKLICRLYDPSSGTVTLDGTPLTDFSQEELRRRITVLFQEPMHYSATVGENIGYGDIDADYELDDIASAAREAGIDDLVRTLPSQYETVLGRWFSGGTELSVGEWQRIALARAFVRQAPIIVLDEPTSAMDSWAETDWLARFRKFATGRTAIVVTHRLTTAMKADRIAVMQEGKVVESGSHSELLQLNGHYAATWQAHFGERRSA